MLSSWYGTTGHGMAQLIVRNLEEPIVRALKRRAARNGRSAEEEHRIVLRAALIPGPGTTLGEALLAMPEVGEDRDFARARDEARPVEL